MRACLVDAALCELLQNVELSLDGIKDGVEALDLRHGLPDGELVAAQGAEGAVEPSSSVHDAYAGPGRDVMAHVNGMSRIARYSTWTRDPFTA